MTISFSKTLLTLVIAWIAAHFSDARARTFVQAVHTDYVAFEAEAADSFTNNATIQWERIDDTQASGGAALYARGQSSLGTPGGIATYKIRFSYPGKYVLYSRWKADSAVTDISPFAANSFSYPRTLGPAPQWSRSLANERDVPESLAFGWTEDFVEYAVTPAQVAAGEPMVFLLGTREAGLILDRVVLKQAKGETPEILNALVNSPDDTDVPVLVSALAGNDLTSVYVTFSQPIVTAAATNFSISGLMVTGVAIDPANARRVIVGTTNQIPGAEYTVAINNVAGASGAPIVPAIAAFRAAQLLPGWVSVARLGQALDRFDFASAGPIAEPLELRAYFIPPEDGRYNIYIRNSAETEVSLTSADPATNLFTGVFAGTNEQFNAEQSITTPFLTAGSRHLLIAKIAPTNSPVSLSFAAAVSGSADEPALLSPVSGTNIAALLNPDAAELRITGQPVSLPVSGGQTASFSVTASAAVAPIYYQWQKNGEDIPGATGSSFTTPVLSGADSGATYRARLKAGGQEIFSSESVLLVSPGNLDISRETNGVVVRWEAAAIGATLEASAKAGPDATWVPVSGPIAAAGSLRFEQLDTRFFRLRN